MSDESVTQWIDQLRAGNPAAAQGIWERYYETLVRHARQKLQAGPRRAADEEDVALSAFHSFCQRCAEGRFPRLIDREGLWRLLFTITERKALRHQKYESRQKRAVSRLRNVSLFVSGDGSNGAGPGDTFVSREPSPEFAAIMAEEVRRLLGELADPSLCRVAVLKMEGHTVREIADHLGCAAITVKRKLQLIRSIWSAEIQ